VVEMSRGFIDTIKRVVGCLISATTVALIMGATKLIDIKSAIYFLVGFVSASILLLLIAYIGEKFYPFGIGT
jgi:hypothetical protein